MANVDFSVNKAHEGAFIVYLNGIEVPVDKISYSCSVGDLPQVSISMFPDSEIARLGAEDRMEVQVFYKDDFYSSIEGKSPDFRLLFEGEVRGWSYTNTAGGRHISLTCQHSTAVLSDLPLYFLTGLDSMVASTSQQNAPQAQAVAPDMVLPWALFFHGLAPLKQEKGETIKRPWEFIENFFKGCNSVEGAPDLGSIVTSTFYNRLFMRRRTQFHFVPSPILEFELVKQKEYTLFPLLKAVRDDVLLSSLSSRMEEIGLGSSVWEALTSMFQSMYYEIATIPAPPIALVRDGYKVEDVGLILGPYTGETRYSKPYLIHHVTKPQWLFGIAPACNVLFPSMIQSLMFEEDYTNQPTRCIIARKEIVDTTPGSSKVVNDILKIKSGYPTQVSKEMQRVSSNAATSGRNFLVWPEEYFRGPLVAMSTYPRWFQLLNDIVWGTASTEQQLAKKTLDSLDLAIQKIWTTAYSQACEQNKITTSFASPIAEAEGVTRIKQNIQADLEAKLFNELSQKNSVIDELKQSGVLTRQVTSLDDLRKALSERVQENTVQVENPLRLYARYEYHRLRSGARRGTVYTAFNPYIVPGFPTIVFNSEEDGNHFVGYVTSVQHTLNASNPPSMSTAISFVHGQTLDELVQEIFDARIGNNPENYAYDISAAPPNAIATLRNVLQIQDKAESYFSQLFHLGVIYTDPREKTKAAAFDISKIIQFKVPGIKKPELYSFNDIFTDTDTVAEIDRKKKEFLELQKQEKEELDNIQQRLKVEYTLSGMNTEWVNLKVDEEMRVYTAIKDQEYATKLAQQRLKKSKENPPNKILDNYTKILPTDDYAPMFQSYERAMEYVSRPVCTLDEYVKFRKSWGVEEPKKVDGKWIDKRGTVPENDPIEGKGAKFYRKILDMRQGPGNSPILDANNNPIDPVPKNLPDTRTDWQTRLLNYRKRILYGRIRSNSGE